MNGPVVSFVLSRWSRRVQIPRGFALLALVVILVPACGGPSTDPLAAETCDELVDTAVAIVATAGDGSDGISLEEFDASRGQLRLDLAGVAARAGELSCPGDVNSDSYRRALADLESDTARRGEVIIDAAMLDPFQGTS